MHEIQQRAKEIRQRLMYPPNAVPDRPLIPSRPATGITGRTVESRRQAALRAQRRDAIIEAVKQAPKRPLQRIERTQRMIADDFDVPYEIMFDKSRRRRYTTPRQTAMYMIKVLFGLSLPDIGRRFGGRDHTTALHAIKRVQRRIDSDPEFAAYIQGLTERIDGP